MKKKLSQYRELVEEWDWQKNSKTDINQITYGSRKKFWWICKKNKSHKWAAIVNNRTTKNSGCPYCSNQKIDKKNNLKYFHPKLAKEWHPKKNLNIKPEHISGGSSKKYWWQCKKGHSWLASPNSRTRNYHSNFKKKKILGTGCPYCSNQKVCEDNNLEFLYPKIAKQWHPTKNKKIKPKDIVAKSNKKYWWICKKGHTFQCSAYVKVMTNGCYYCAGKRVCDDNSLKILYPKIANQWHPTKNRNLTPDKFTAGSMRSFWWRCSYDHEWKASIHSRTKRKSNCPFCSNKKVHEKNSLFNCFPKIAKEWHPTRNGSITSKQVVYGSNRNVWWICQNGHEWKAMVVSRTGPKGTGCPRCSKRISSFEIRILSELESFFKNIKPIYKLKGTEIDLLLEDYKIGIEYDGWYYHKNRFQEDKVKNNFLKKNNIDLIRLRERPLKKVSKRDILIKQNELKKSDLNKLLEQIIQITKVKNKKILQYINKKKFQSEAKYRKYLSFYPAPIPQNSLKESHKSLVEEWDFVKNFPLKPENFYTNSGLKVWWRCKKGHSWKIRIANRTGKQETGCPFCAGKKIDKNNNLETLFPKIAQEFHKTRNGKFKPKDLSPGSHKKYWWKCRNGHEWKAIIKSRTEQKTGCPYCSGHLATKENNLKKLYPNLMKEWHPTKNRKIDPSKLRPGSNLDVWWKCKKGHSWSATIARRTLTKSGCVYCANLKVSKTNNLQAISPKLAKEWHPTKNKPITPKDIIAGTAKKYWWLCKNGHEFKGAPSNRLKKNYITKCMKCFHLKI